MRLYYLDWLRVITMVVVFYFHCARVFDGLYYWHIKSAAPSILLTLFVIFAGQWIMPLMFLLSGAATSFNLRLRRGAGYINERFRRLVIPFVFGTLLIAPPQAYLERASRGMFGGSYWLYLQQHCANFRDYRAAAPDFWFWPVSLGHHLWFLGFLVIFSVAALPLFLYLQSPAGQKIVAAAARLCRVRGGIFLFAVPLGLIQFLLRYHYPAYVDWGNFFYWLAFFVFGFFIFAGEGFERAVERDGPIALLLAAVTYVPVAATLVGYFDWRYLFGANWGYAAEQFAGSLNAWAVIVAVLFLGRKLLNFPHRSLRYANEAVLPFYILHQTVIVIAAYYVVRWSGGNLAHFLIISTASLAICVALYEFLIRRFNPARFLFGMKAAPGKLAPGASAAPRGES